MKTIIALIHPGKLEAVQEALEQQVEVARMTAADALGYAEQPDLLQYRGAAVDVHLASKIMVRIVVNDDFVDRTVELLTSVAKTGSEGRSGDGKIFVLDVESAVRVRTGETNADAL